MYIYLITGIIIFQAVIYFAFHKKVKQIAYLFVCQSVTFGLFYGILFPPFTVSDELTHFLSGYHIANIIQGMHDERINDLDTGAAYYNMQVRDVDDALFSDFPCEFDINSLSDNKMEHQKLFVRSNGYMIKEGQFTTDYFPFPEYTLMGIIIAIGRMLNLSAFGLVWMTRIANLTAYSLIGMYAVKIIPFGKQMLYTVLLMPMGMHFSCSASYHALLYASAVFYIAYIVYLQEESRLLSGKQKLFLIVQTVILTPVKGSFLFYGFLVLLLPRELFLSQKKYVMFLSGVILTGVLSWFIYNAYTVDIGMLISDQYGKRMITYMDAGEGIYLSDIIKDPLHYIKVFIRTVCARGLYFDRSMVQIRLDTGSLSSVFCMLVFLFNSFFNDSPHYFKNKIRDKRVFIFVYLASYALLSFVAFFEWGARSWTVIELKGAYTFQFLPLAGLALKRNVRPDMSVQKHTEFTFFMICAIHLTVIFHILFTAGVI